VYFFVAGRLRNSVQNAYNDWPVTVCLNRLHTSTGHATRGLKMSDSSMMERS
jgi:hypothetical protein